MVLWYITQRKKSKTVGSIMLSAFHKTKSSSSTSHTKSDTLKMRYEDRITHTANPLTQDLLSIMATKKTNLCVAADVRYKQELLDIAEAIGRHICILKLHIDIIDDFDQDLPKMLADIAHRHNFILFEDRKFADIGNTVQQQYEGGVYKISSWAQLVNAHSVPGDGVVEGLKKVRGTRKDRALILIGEMSSKGNLCTPEYSRATVEMANRHADFVMGYISMSQLTDNPGLLHMTPGIQFVSKDDALGQQYRSPEEAIATGSDIIIVGRGITHAHNKSEAAEAYKKAGWQAYQQRIEALPSSSARLEQQFS